MGVKVSKQDQVFEQRFNYLKSLVSDAADYIDNYDGSKEDAVPVRKQRQDNHGSIKLEAPKINFSSPKKNSGTIFDSSITSPMNRGRLSERKDSFKIRPSMNKRASEAFQVGSEVTNFLDFGLEPLTPTTFMKQSKGKLDEEMRNILDALIHKKYANLSNTRVYLHSEIPLDDEKPMEEKSCKIADRSKNQGVDDFEDNVRRYSPEGEDGWDHYENSKQHFYEIGIAMTCRKGEAADSPNQDNYFVYVDAYTKMYCVYDGHGPYGNLVSYFISMNVAKCLLEEPIYLVDPVGAIKEAFTKAESTMKTYVQKKDSPFDVHLSGTCATLVLQRSNMLYIGQLGDSKVMIGRKNKNKKGMTLEQLTFDHVPYSLEEKKRIYAKGGEVRIWNGDGDERVFAKGRVYPCLATTRSLGDEIGSLIGIISEPEIFSVEINPATDVFLLIGSSPVFTYLDDNEILNVMNYANVSKIRETVDILVKKAKNAWLQNENSFEDMTLVISYL